MEEKIIDGVDVAGQMFYIDCENWLDRFIDYFNKWKKELIEENAQLKARLTPFEDSYFKGLSSIEIAGLAKKSIRITSYNRKLETALEEIKIKWNEFKKLSPLEIGLNQELVYELDRIITKVGE